MYIIIWEPLEHLSPALVFSWGVISTPQILSNPHLGWGSLEDEAETSVGILVASCLPFNSFAIINWDAQIFISLSSKGLHLCEISV